MSNPNFLVKAVDVGVVNKSNLQPPHRAEALHQFLCMQDWRRKGLSVLGKGKNLSDSQSDLTFTSWLFGY